MKASACSLILVLAILLHLSRYSVCVTPAQVLREARYVETSLQPYLHASFSDDAHITGGASLFSSVSAIISNQTLIFSSKLDGVKRKPLLDFRQWAAVRGPAFVAEGELIMLP